MLFSKKIKDISFRKKYLNNEKFILINKYIKIWLLNLSPKKLLFSKYLFLFLKKKQLKSFKVKITNRCIVTNRSRSNFRKFSLSRLCLKQFSSFGILPGLKKSVW